ncbi:hypothetical protein JCM19240_4856 [Vibrio maritimus]|uniref:Antitoxin Xre/MbcA/ParS-like toxin-binding domain-containing protein n=1 Tax=Vibrio maritimus TaxID=990268 RepID=A0A090T7K3_9VIBR|nr:hypothetical protein JCM19240_4856 [Vibrio maritimus]
MSNVDKASTLLRAWGVSANKVEQLRSAVTFDQQATHIIAIEECLVMLYSDKALREKFLSTPSKSVMFEGKKPLDIITSGELDKVTEAHYVIRSMLCV